MEAKRVDDPTAVKRLVDRLRRRLVETQKELKDDEQLEVVDFLPSGAAVAMDAVGFQSLALLTRKGRELASGE